MTQTFRCFYITLNIGFKYLVFTNILIALAAACQSALTYIVFGKPVNWDVLMVEWSSTLLLYNFTLYLSLPKDPAASPFLRTRWVATHMHLFVLMSMAATCILLYFTLKLAVPGILLLGAIAVLAIIYFIPVIKYQGRWAGLRQIPGLKLFHIALVWVMSTVLLPFVQLHAEGISIDVYLCIAVALSRFMFLLICTLPFDIRDMEADRPYGLRTIPLIIGEKKSKLAVYLTLFLHSAWMLTLPLQTGIKIGFLLTNILVLLLDRFVVLKKKNYFNAYLLDLVLVVQFFIVFLALYL